METPLRAQGGRFRGKLGGIHGFRRQAEGPMVQFPVSGTGVRRGNRHTRMETRQSSGIAVGRLRFVCSRSPCDTFCPIVATANSFDIFCNMRMIIR